MSSGGKREGAGRPRKGNRVAMTIRIDRGVAESLKQLAEAMKCPLGEVVEDAIRKIKRG